MFSKETNQKKASASYDLNEQLKYARPAVQGEQGQASAFATACRLWRNSADSNEVTLTMNHYNSTQCFPKFNQTELTRIINDAYAYTSEQGDVGKFRKSLQATPQAPQATQFPQASIKVTPNIQEDESLLSACVACADVLSTDAKLPTRMRKRLAERGISERGINQFMLGLACDDSPLSKWLTIPLFDVENNLQGVISKTFAVDGAKYIKSGSSCLFGTSGRQNADVAVVCEGQLDCVLMWQLSSSVAICTVGSVNHGIDEAGLAWLKSRKKVILALDNDKAGKQSAEKWRVLIPDAILATKLPVKDVSELWQQEGERALISWMQSNGIK